MTKEELIRALDPFTDETEVLIHDGGRSYEIDHTGYGTILATEYGCVLLHRGAQVVCRWMPRRKQVRA